MKTSHRHRLVLGSIASIALLASLLVAASPAQAYSGLEVKTAVVRTEPPVCEVLSGSLRVTGIGLVSCYLDDTADDTFFLQDTGGVAIKIQVHLEDIMVAKVEFHPQDEVFYVYDTANDGDGINAELYDHATGILYGPYSAPGTNDRIDFRRVDIPDIPEGHLVSVHSRVGPADRC
jgi:hypothetical protein